METNDFWYINRSFDLRQLNHLQTRSEAYVYCSRLTHPLKFLSFLTFQVNQYCTMVRKLTLFFILYFTTYMIVTPGMKGLEFSLIPNEDAENPLIDRAEAYRSFIGSLRELLPGRNPRRVHDIPVLRAPTMLPDEQRYLQVELVNSAENRVTVIIDVSNVYVLGFIAGNVRRHFPDCPASYRTLFNSELLSYTSNYNALENLSSQRSELNLGRGPLDNAIAELQYWRGEDTRYARPLLVIIQMIAEGARFISLEQRIANAIQVGSNYIPLPDMVLVQNNWARLSTDIQVAVGGIFPNTFAPRDGGEIMFQADTFAQLAEHIAMGLLLFYQNQGRNFQNGGRGCGLQSIGDSKLRCLSQVSGRIAGFNGRCLEATDNLGVPNLHLSDCNYQEPKQGWGFQTDGTIVWEEKYCLGINTADPPEVRLMECDMPGVAQWMLSPEGMMVERRKNLYLTASNFVSLVLDKDQQGPSQFWVFGKSIDPLMVKIIGFGTNLCMEYDPLSFRLSMAPCKDVDTQLWYHYPDKTVRPVPHLCITVEINQQLSPVISQCHGFGYTVWFFNGNGTISGANLFAWFMQANADLSISLGRPTSKWNQQWIVESYLYVGLRGENV